MITLEIAKRLFDEINKTTLGSFKNDLINLAVEYSRLRVEWYLTDDETKREMDHIRTAKHNAFIDSCNILSREMIKIGEDAGWRKVLGNDRKTIGDFACFVNLFLGIKAG